MKVDRDLVLHVARLARLELTEAEVSHYETQLGRVVDYMSVLDKVPMTGGVDWKSGASFLNGVERPDVEKPSLPIDVALSQAPETHGSSFQVPKIIE